MEETHLKEQTSYQIRVKVLSQKGTCSFGHNEGDVVLFDGECVQGRICMSALFSFIPKVYAMRFGAKFPWLENPDVMTHACPDAANPVVFEILRLREK